MGSMEQVGDQLLVSLPQDCCVVANGVVGGLEVKVAHKVLSVKRWITLQNKLAPELVSYFSTPSWCPPQENC